MLATPHIIKDYMKDTIAVQTYGVRIAMVSSVCRSKAEAYKEIPPLYMGLRYGISEPVTSTYFSQYFPCRQ